MREERLDALERELREVEALLSDPATVADPSRLVALSRRRKVLEPVVDLIGRRHRALEDRDAAIEMIAEMTGDDRDEMRAELTATTERIRQFDDELKVLLLPKDPNDERAVILEIRGAEGGAEANLFARDLFEMYRGFSARRGWKFQVLGSSPTELGGFSEITVRIEGDGAWTRLQFEAGPHRVQRVPVTESQGRVHTSSATVTVMPEAEEVDVLLDPADLTVDVFRSSGPGGQSVNTTDSAVRLTHRPTGLVVTMQDEKSQIQNRARAMTVLRSRLLKLSVEQAASEASDVRRAQTGGGGRSEKIRTYNVKENRVTDHRIGLSIYQLDRVLAGELDEISDALVNDLRARQLAEHGQ